MVCLLLSKLRMSISHQYDSTNFKLNTNWSALICRMGNTTKIQCACSSGPGSDSALIRQSGVRPLHSLHCDRDNCLLVYQRQRNSRLCCFDLRQRSNDSTLAVVSLTNDVPFALCPFDAHQLNPKGRDVSFRAIHGADEPDSHLHLFIYKSNTCAFFNGATVQI